MWPPMQRYPDNNPKIMRLVLLLSLFYACASAQPQPDPRPVDFFLDPLGKEYYLLSDGQLTTSNRLGQNDFIFFDSSLGVPDVTDVTNPFAILLYYADYGTLVVLDRTLNEISRLELFDLTNIDQPTAIARATDNGIWLFDSWDYRLKLLDQRSNLSQQSNDLRLSIQAADPPTRIYVYQNLVFLHYSEEQRMAQFTNYGRFERWIDLPPAKHYGWYGGRLLGQAEEEIWIWDVRTGARTQVQGEVTERCLPVSGGYRRLGKQATKTTLIEIK